MDVSEDDRNSSLEAGSLSYQDEARVILQARYDPFYTTKGVGRGTGLGLAVSYGIVQEHSDHISVESSPGRGTAFRITLPTANARALLQSVGD